MPGQNYAAAALTFATLTVTSGLLLGAQSAIAQPTQPRGTAALASAAARTPAIAASQAKPLSCADRFHARLQKVAASEFARLETALQNIITTDASIPTAWRFWRPVRPRGLAKRRRRDGSLRPIVYRGRVCVDERVMRNGRIRCFKWEPATKARIAELTRYVPPLDPAPPRRERRDLRFLNDTVANKGALSAFQEEGRFFWLVRRAVSELEMYVRQDPNPGLCLGARTLLSFYRQQMKPMDDRISYVRTLARRADQRFARQIKRLDRLEAARQKRAATARKKAATAWAKAELELRASAGLPPIIPVVGQSTGPKTSPVLPDGQVGAVAQTIAFVTPDTASDEPQLTAEMTVGLALDAARAHLDRPEHIGLSKRRRGYILGALRAVETRLIAEKTLAIYARYREAVAQTLQAIEASHSSSCNCGR